MVKGGAFQGAKPVLVRSDLARAVGGALGIGPREAREVVDLALAAIMEAVARGDSVELRGIGTFRRRTSPPRPARDFRTGTSLRAPGGPRVGFRVSRSLRASLNGAREEAG